MGGLPGLSEQEDGEGRWVPTLVCGMGVSQGSVAGPVLWDIFYNAIMNTPLPGGARLIAYADDLILVVGGDSDRQIGETVAVAVRNIKRWLEARELKIALLRCPRGAKLSANLLGTVVRSEVHVDYLGDSPATWLLGDI